MLLSKESRRSSSEVEKGGVDQIEFREKSNYYVEHRKDGNKIRGGSPTMKKVVAIVMAIAMLLSVTSAFAEKTKLTVWSIAVEGDANYQTYKDAIADFNATNEKYELVMESTENEAYKTKIKAAMSAGEGLPDIFFTWSMSFLGDFVQAGRVYCLDEVLPTYKEELTDAMLANTNYDGKQYGVPLTFNVVTLFANMAFARFLIWLFSS